MEVAGSPMGEARRAEDKNGVERRVWESQDFTITKIVVEEGEDDGGKESGGGGGEMSTPRFGAACSVQGELRFKLFRLGCENGTLTT